MTYIGATPTTGDFKILDSITTSSTTTFNLRQGGVAVYPQSSSHCLVVLNGILQTAGSSFNIVNDTIVFSSSLASTDVINQILVLGNVNDIGVPSDDTCSQAKIQNEAINEAKMQISNAGSNGQFLSKQSGNTGGLTWAAAGGAADDYFASSGLSAKDLGTGLHIKTGDSGASVVSSADDLIIETDSGDNGLSILSPTDGQGQICFGDSGDNDIGKISYAHAVNELRFNVSGSETFRQNSSTTKFNYNGTHDLRSYGWVANGTGQGWKISRDSNQGSMLIETHLTTNRTMFSVINGNGTIGTISVNGSTTSYNTSSDYRLKESVNYDWDATTRLKQLKPARFNWIADDTNTLQDGFIAHEVTSIVPEAVNGEKDAMKMEEYIVSGTIEDDNAVMGEREVIDSQSIDQSKLVPLLVKTIQELEARITALEG